MPYFPWLSRGDGWVMCCICFEIHSEPFDQLVVDSDGVKWDVCVGKCAEDAGVQ